MNLGIFLSPGDSLENQSEYGQDKRFIKYYLKPYSEQFENISVFSYGDVKYGKNMLPKNVHLVVNSQKINYYLYQFLMLFILKEKIKKCDLFRVMQTTGGIPAVISSIFFKKKFFVTYGYDYSDFAFVEGKYFRSILSNIVVKIVLNKAYRIIVTTKTNFEKLSKKFKGKVILIPNGVDTKMFTPKNKKNKENISILNIGRLSPQKNQFLLIDAIDESQYKNKIELTIMGKGKLKSKLLDLAKKKKVKLKILDNIEYEKMPQVFQDADIFCFPSKIEGNPKVLIEAMACGLAIIASSIEANKQLIKDKDNGLLCGLNSEDLARTIDFLIENPQSAKEYVDKARQDCVKNFDIKKLITKEIDLLKKR